MAGSDRGHPEDRAQEIFEEISELPPEEQERRLDELCDDEEVRREVERMLGAYGRLQEMMDVMEEADLPTASEHGGRAEPERIDRFELLDRVGEGGMGIVYRARDPQLDRVVALKVLPDRFGGDRTARQRFLREAQTASQLDHPNVAPLHEYGETDDGRTYIVMPFYDGDTLEDRLTGGPLDPDEALEIGTQLCEGLAAAHEEGIVHRDVKPGNVLLPDGQPVKLVDFGLAKWTGETSITRTDSVLGSVAYMSPEQLQGQPLDERTDVWSAGVVLYEMLTGERPFEGRSPETLAYEIIDNEHEPPSSVGETLPDQIDAVLANCLAKEPSDRYASAADLASDLEEIRDRLGFVSSSSSSQEGGGDEIFQFAGSSFSWVQGSAAVAGILLIVAVFWALITGGFAGSFDGFPSSEQAGTSGASSVDTDSALAHVDPASVAVLPFTYYAAEDSADYLSLGMTDEILTRLSKIEALSVRGRTSVMRYQGTDKGIPQIGRELQVAHLLEGSIQQIGSQLQIRIRLVDTRRDEPLWSRSFESRFENVLDLQNQVARTVAEQLPASIGIEEKRQLTSAPEVDPEAYRLYLQARELRFQERDESLAEAYKLVKRSIQRDSTFAPAWALLASLSFVRPSLIGGDPWRAARQAVRLDSTSAEAWTALGVLRHFLTDDYTGAARAFHRAIAHNSGLANVRREYANLLLRLGFVDRALKQARRAVELDPASNVAERNLGVALLANGRYRQAHTHISRAARLEGALSKTTYIHLAWVNYYLGDAARAIELARNGGLRGLRVRGYVWGQTGRPDSARMILDTLRAVQEDYPSVPAPLADRAIVHTSLGERDTALDLLDRYVHAYDPRVPPPPGMQIKWAPWFDPIRSDPRFNQILRYLGLDEESLQEVKEVIDEQTA